MKKRMTLFVVSTLFMSFSPIVFAEEVPKYVEEQAKAEGIKEINITTATIKSITKEDNTLTIIYDGFAVMGTHKSQQYMVKFDHSSPRTEAEIRIETRIMALPDDAKEVKIYWGYLSGRFQRVLAIEKLR